MDGLDVICYAHWGPCLSSPPLDEHITHAAHVNNYSKKVIIYKMEMLCRFLSVQRLVSCRYFRC